MKQPIAHYIFISFVGFSTFSIAVSSISFANALRQAFSEAALTTDTAPNQSFIVTSVEGDSLNYAVTPRQKAPFHPATDIGNTQVSVECAYLYIQNPDLRPGTKVWVVHVGPGEPAYMAEAEIIPFIECHEDMRGTWAKLTGNDVEVSLDKYQLRFRDQDVLRPVGYGIGVVNTEQTIRIDGALAWSDLDGDGTDEFFRNCSGEHTEHTTVWSGVPLKGKRIWHASHDFEDDLAVDCKDADY